MEKTRFIIGMDKGEFVPKPYYLALEEKTYEPKPGDFAIVENRDSFAMVEILGTGEMTKEKEKDLVGNSGGIHKKVKYIVPRTMLERK